MITISNVINVYNAYKETINHRTTMDIGILENYISVNDKERLSELNENFRDIFNKNVSWYDYQDTLNNIILNIYNQLNYVTLYNDNIITLLHNISALYDNDILNNINVKYKLNDRKYLYYSDIHTNIQRLNNLGDMITAISNDDVLKSNFNSLNMFLKHAIDNDVDYNNLYFKFHSGNPTLPIIQNRFYPIRIRDLYNKIEYTQVTSKNHIDTLIKTISAYLKDTESYVNNVLKNSIVVSDVISVDVVKLQHMDRVISKFFNSLNESNILNSLRLIHRELHVSINYFLSLTKVI